MQHLRTIRTTTVLDFCFDYVALPPNSQNKKVNSLDSKEHYQSALPFCFVQTGSRATFNKKSADKVGSNSSMLSGEKIPAISSLICRFSP